MATSTPGDGLVLLLAAEQATGIDLVTLVAAASVWAHPLVHSRLMAKNPLGLWYPGVRRYRNGAGEKKGQVVEGVRLDDNTYANFALKDALPLGSRQYSNYAVCHIWPDSCYDERCHTCIANLVLIPSPLMSLTDFHPEIRHALQYRSWELYQWYPPGVSVPSKPARYPSSWRQPEPFTAEVESRVSVR